MSTSGNTAHIVHAATKTAPAIIPGFATAAAQWLDLINIFLGATFMALSVLFLLWRWRVAWKKEQEG